VSIASGGRVVRQQHYRFAHQLLMEACTGNSEQWWSLLSTQGASAVQQLWVAAGQGLGSEDLADGSVITVTPVQSVPGVEALVVTLPPPIAPAECFFVALVRSPGQPARYFVAERGVDAIAGTPRAFWAEWRTRPGTGTMRIRGQDLPAISMEALITAAAAECLGAPATSSPIPAAPAVVIAPKKKGKGALIAGCGCLSVLGFVLAVGGYLLYQEEGRGLHPPSGEVTSIEVKPGQPFDITFKWDGFGYAFNNVWLVVEDGKTDGGSFSAKGAFGCSRSGSPEEVTVGLSERGAEKVEKHGDSFSGWFLLGDEYAHSSDMSIQCGGQLEPVAGSWSKARIVVTQRQRPSDFFAR
jgi:hypothetical protein